MSSKRRDPSDFSERRAVVTGAASGIGHATSQLLLERGASVVACDLSADGLVSLADGGAETCVADLTVANDREQLARLVGACDHLVVAHGVIRPASIDQTTEADWDAIFSANVKSVYFTIQRLAESLRDSASVVTLSSVSARNAASLEQSAYSASKAALSSVTRSFAYAFASRAIRVNAVLPGIVETPMQETFLTAAAASRGVTVQTLRQERLERVPLGREASAGECAETILWLLSPAASYLTGQQIAVDGGLTML